LDYVIRSFQHRWRDPKIDLWRVRLLSDRRLHELRTNR